MLSKLFQNEKNLKEFLANELLKSRLVLFLGSGISFEHHLPKWDNLVEKVCKKAGVTYKPSEDKLVLMDYCRTELDTKYKSVVKSVLYQKYRPDLSSLATNKLLVSVGALIMGSVRGNVSKVITFNYDDILETYLLYHGFSPKIIFEVPYKNFSADVSIYHHHGYLPKYIGKNSNEIVLDQTSYSKKINNVKDPMLNEIQSIILSNTCLLIGLSGKDQSLDSLIVNSKEMHISNKLNYGMLGFIFQEKSEMNDVKIKNFKDKGLFCIEVDDYDTDIPKFLSEVCRIALRKSQPSFISKNILKF